MRLWQRKSGVWYAVIQGKYRSLRTKDEKEARRLFKVLQREHRKGRLVPLDKTKRISLEDFTQEYLAGRGDLSPATLRLDDLSLRNLAEVVGGKTAVRAITAKKIDLFKSACRDRGVSSKSINAYLRHIRAAFNQAHEWGYLDKPLKIKPVKEAKQLPRVLSPQERSSILTFARENDFEMWRIITFSLWTGCRRTETLKLHWTDITLGTDPFCRVRGKGNKERIVPVLPPAVEAMGVPKDIGPVFQQWHRDTLSHRFKQIARRCGIEDVHFHNLRHSAATQMIESGIMGDVVQKILGHSDYRTTQIYVNLSHSTLSEEMRKLKY